MLPFLKFVPLVLSTAALICLAVVFSACTSTSSPQDLFFMEVKLTEFPKIDHLNLVRSFDRDSSSPLQKGNVVDRITGSAENAVDQIGGHVQDLSDQLHSLLPEYYAVGLWSYCESKQGAEAFSNCSGPSAAFSFDLVDLLSSRLGQANGVLADWTQPVLKGYRHLSHWIVVAYITAVIAAFIAVVTGLVGFPLAKLVAIISSAVSQQEKR
ncbi:actin cortical patch SUR7/pH-response regulator pali [Aspergillus pseudodeflectus]|uniref:Actin cortical patch SUR7/pH-response regulator pali n=1 Tax=Aspergillus pseudodeflectus TaxID=176178 RepID=A0ABR4JFA6_9EURO